MSTNAVPPARSDDPRRRRFERLGDEFPKHHPHHCTCRESEPDREDRLEPVNENERGNGKEWLGQAREDAPSRRCADRSAARNEDEADREPLGDVVHRDRDRDQQAKRRSVSERSSDPDSFGRGMDCHHADDQERPPRVLAAQRSQGVSVVVREVALRHQHEADSQRKTDRGAPQAAIDALSAEADARREHHPRRDRVRRAQHEPTGGADEDQRQSTKPGRQGRHESSEEHRDDVRLHCGDPSYDRRRGPQSKPVRRLRATAMS